MGSLSFFTELLVDVPAQLSCEQSRCLRRRLNRCDCTKCLDVCHCGALSLHDSQVRLEAGKCSRCMLCTTVCPNDVFEIQSLDLEKELNSLPIDTPALVSCERQPQLHPEELVIPCLGGISVEHLLGLGMRRNGLTAFNISGCTGCKNSRAAEIFLGALTHLAARPEPLLNSTLTVLTKPEQVALIHKENRRSFLAGLRRSLFSAVEAQFASGAPDTPSGVKQNRRTPKQRALVKKLLKHADAEQKKLVTSFCVYTLEVADNCTGCPLCKGICPTGAIRLETSPGQKKLALDNTACSGCGLCVTFCKEQAISLHPPKHGRIAPMKLAECHAQTSIPVPAVQG